MQSTKELFGNVPRYVWLQQRKLAVSRVKYAKMQLGKSLARPTEERDYHMENKIHGAIRFWELLRDEAKDELLANNQRKKAV